MDPCTASPNHGSSQCDLILLFLSWRNEILFLPLVRFTWKCIYTVHKETPLSSTFLWQTAPCLTWIQCSKQCGWWPEFLIVLWSSFEYHMRACVYLCVFVFLPVVDRGRCALNALGALCLSVLFCLNRSLPFSNRKLPLFLSQVTSYECTIFSFFPLHANIWVILKAIFTIFLLFKNICNFCSFSI